MLQERLQRVEGGADVGVYQVPLDVAVQLLDVAADVLDLVRDARLLGDVVALHLEKLVLPLEHQLRRMRLEVVGGQLDGRHAVVQLA